MIRFTRALAWRIAAVLIWGGGIAVIVEWVWRHGGGK